jgi:hypothetical protein
MRKWLTLLLAAVLYAPFSAQAQQVCPWLTEGTAAAQLGGPVKLSIKVVSPAEGTCDFTSQQGNLLAVLEISVANSAVAICPAGGEHLTGIGNDATACRLGDAPSQRREVVSSFVRSLKFSVSLAVRGPTSAAFPKERQSTIVRQVAEQVAGSLD